MVPVRVVWLKKQTAGALLVVTAGEGMTFLTIVMENVKCGELLFDEEEMYVSDSFVNEIPNGLSVELMLKFAGTP